MRDAVWNGVKNLGEVVLKLVSLVLATWLIVVSSVLILFGVCFLTLLDTLSIRKPKDSAAERMDSRVPGESPGSYGAEMLDNHGLDESSSDLIH